jgi:hypothetical protein
MYQFGFYRGAIYKEAARRYAGLGWFAALDILSAQA